MAIAWGNILGAVGSGLTGNVAGVVSNVSAALSGGKAVTGAKGGLVGGTVTNSGGGRVTIKTTAGNLVTIKRARRRRGFRRGGNSMNSMLKTAMQYKMLANAMK